MVSGNLLIHYLFFLSYYKFASHLLQFLEVDNDLVTFFCFNMNLSAISCLKCHLVPLKLVKSEA
jgi:hypothetical protein